MSRIAHVISLSGRRRRNISTRGVALLLWKWLLMAIALSVYILTRVVETLFLLSPKEIIRRNSRRINVSGVEGLSGRSDGSIAVGRHPPAYFRSSVLLRVVHFRRWAFALLLLWDCSGNIAYARPKYRRLGPPLPPVCSGVSLLRFQRAGSTWGCAFLFGRIAGI